MGEGLPKVHLVGGGSNRTKNMAEKAPNAIDVHIPTKNTGCQQIVGSCNSGYEWSIDAVSCSLRTLPTGIDNCEGVAFRDTLGFRR